MTDKKKIVFMLNDFYPGGAEKVVYELVSRLDRERFSLNVAAVVGDGGMLDEFKEIAPVDLIGRTENYRSFRGRLNWLISSPAVLFRSIAYLRREKPDIVTTSLYHADLIGIFSAYLAGVKRRIIIQHDVHKLSWPRKVLKILFAIKLATEYAAISGAVKGFLVDYFGAKEKKVVVIKNGVDVKRFSAARKELDLRNIIIGSVGRLEKEKGYATLVGALRVLKERGLRPHAIIVGGGGEEKALQVEAERYGLDIEWVGAVKDPVPYLAKMDVAIIPSLEEGFGLTVAEALAGEKIVIASDLLAIRDMIADEKNGVLFKAGDCSMLADKLEEILKDKERVIELKSKTRDWVSAHWRELDISRTVEEYSDLLANG